MTTPELNSEPEDIGNQSQLPPEGRLGGRFATFKETIAVVDPSDPSKGYIKVLTGELAIDQDSSEAE